VTHVLGRLRTPADLRTLSHEELVLLAAEIRDALVQTVSRTGGHLGPNLGAVELTIAVHRVFDSPTEPILFDVGHQAYVHKMLTGRAEQMPTLRQTGGLSGYPSRAESAHDWIENSRRLDGAADRRSAHVCAKGRSPHVGEAPGARPAPGGARPACARAAPAL